MRSPSQAMLLEKLLAHLDLKVEPFALCELASGWRLNLAGPGHVVLHFVLAGRGRLRSTAGEIDLEPDTLIVIPRALGHAIESEGPVGSELAADANSIPTWSGVHRIAVGDGGVELLVACARVHATYGGSSGLFDRLTAPLVQDFSDLPRMREAFSTLVEEQAGQRSGGQRMTESILNECFVLLLRRLCESHECHLPWIEAVTDERLARALDSILDHPERGHTLDQLAATAGMSRTSFTESFSKVFGRSVGDLLRETRLRKGAHLLRTTDLPVQSVAHRVGFSSRSHFSRAFTAEFGKGPAEFRVRG